MENIVADRPNLTPETVPVENVSSGLDAIAQKMAAMKEQTLRNQIGATNPTETGSSEAAATEAPVAPDGIESDTNNVEPEVVEPEAEYAEGNEEELLLEADAQHEAAVGSALEASEEEWQLLKTMQTIAEAARYEADSRVRRLEQLIRQHLCPRVHHGSREACGNQARGVLQRRGGLRPVIPRETPRSWRLLALRHRNPPRIMRRASGSPRG